MLQKSRWPWLRGCGIGIATIHFCHATYTISQYLLIPHGSKKKLKWHLNRGRLKPILLFRTMSVQPWLHMSARDSEMSIVRVSANLATLPWLKHFEESQNSGWVKVDQFIPDLHCTQSGTGSVPDTMYVGDLSTLYAAKSILPASPVAHRCTSPGWGAGVPDKSNIDMMFKMNVYAGEKIGISQLCRVGMYGS